jgi:long-subunit acyl-CoA synthetase (AMP-forming)
VTHAVTSTTAVPTLESRTLCEAFQATAARDPAAVALRTFGGDQEITWSEYARRVRDIASGLAALGIGRGDTVGLMLSNRLEFNVLDTAVLHLGATPFSVYNTSSPEQIAYLFENAQNRVVITEPTFIERVQAAASGVEHVVCLDDAPAGTISLDDLEARSPGDFDFEAAWRQVQPEDVVTLIYTSGTTGPPKGVELTHANMMASVRAVAQLVALQPTWPALSYLPSAHLVDRWISHYLSSMVLGGAVTSVPDAKQVMAALPSVRPGIWAAVPRLWEKMKGNFESQGITDPAELPAEAKAQVLRKLGLDRAQLVFSGAAAIDPGILQFFAGLGVEICEGWGMSELAAVGAINPPGRSKPGTVGLPIPGIELKLAQDGEILVRGPIVMKGYRNDPERTAQAFDADGWLLTGDIGSIDDEGYVSIVDRKKDLIINAAGKNMSPANIEAALKGACPLIAHAVCIGDRRPYNVALVALDAEEAATWAGKHGRSGAEIADLATDEDLQAEIARGVEAANARLSRVEQIKKFAVVPHDWQPGGEEVTPTMKVKRKVIVDKYTAQIDALYQG